MAHVPDSELLNPPLPSQSYDEFLDAFQEKWNKRIDKEVKVLAEGLGKMVTELDRGVTPVPHMTDTSALGVSTLSSQLVQASENLLSITHQLKLWTILSDEEAIKKGEREEREVLEKELKQLREEVKGLLKDVGGP